MSAAMEGDVGPTKQQPQQQQPLINSSPTSSDQAWRSSGSLVDPDTLPVLSGRPVARGALNRLGSSADSPSSSWQHQPTLHQPPQVKQEPLSEAQTGAGTAGASGPLQSISARMPLVPAMKHDPSSSHDHEDAGFVEHELGAEEDEDFMGEPLSPTLSRWRHIRDATDMEIVQAMMQKQAQDWAAAGAVSRSMSEDSDGGLRSGSVHKSRFRGVSYDKKKRKWRVQIKQVATLGKSGVSVGYYDTEEAAARAYDRAAIGLLGRDSEAITTNFPLKDYANEAVPELSGKSREEVKNTLKNERAKQVPRRRFTCRQRTSRFMGVGSSNRNNQWQARILVHGKVTHLGYYEGEQEAARVYDKVAISLHGGTAQTNFPIGDYPEETISEFRGMSREELQRALGVKPMDKSSKYKGVSKKKGRWEAKVMVNRKWAYRELFDSEEAAARAYDTAVWRLKPKEAASYVNFKDKPGTITNKLAIAAKSMQRAQSRENLAGLREDKGAGPAPTRPPSRRLAGQDPVGPMETDGAPAPRGGLPRHHSTSQLMQSAGSCSPDGSGASEGSSSGVPRVASANQLALGQTPLTLGSSAPDLGMGGAYRGLQMERSLLQGMPDTLQSAQGQGQGQGHRQQQQQQQQQHGGGLHLQGFIARSMSAPHMHPQAAAGASMAAPLPPTASGSPAPIPCTAATLPPAVPLLSAQSQAHFMHGGGLGSAHGMLQQQQQQQQHQQQRMDQQMGPRLDRAHQGGLMHSSMPFPGMFGAPQGHHVKMEVGGPGLGGERGWLHSPIGHMPFEHLQHSWSAGHYGLQQEAKPHLAQGSHMSFTGSSYPHEMHAQYNSTFPQLEGLGSAPGLSDQASSDAAQQQAAQQQRAAMLRSMSANHLGALSAAWEAGAMPDGPSLAAMGRSSSTSQLAGASCFGGPPSSPSLWPSPGSPSLRMGAHPPSQSRTDHQMARGGQMGSSTSRTGLGQMTGMLHGQLRQPGSYSMLNTLHAPSGGDLLKEQRASTDILGDLPTALDSECNSPLKLLQIGGDDLQMFDRDDPSENADYLLTDDVAQAFD